MFFNNDDGTGSELTGIFARVEERLARRRYSRLGTLNNASSQLVFFDIVYAAEADRFRKLNSCFGIILWHIGV